MQDRSERQAQELRSLRHQVQQEQEAHMSERAALHQKLAALEASTQNAAEQASQRMQENGAQLQATAQKLQQEVQVWYDFESSLQPLKSCSRKCR